MFLSYYYLVNYGPNCGEILALKLVAHNVYPERSIRESLYDQVSLIFTFLLEHYQYCSRIRTYLVKNTTNKNQQLLDSDNLGDVRSFWFKTLAKIAQNGLLTV